MKHNTGKQRKPFFKANFFRTSQEVVGSTGQWKKSRKHLKTMRKVNNNSWRNIANSLSLDEFDDLYEEEVRRESKEFRKGKDPHHGLKKDSEGIF